MLTPISETPYSIATAGDTTYRSTFKKTEIDTSYVINDKGTLVDVEGP